MKTQFEEIQFSDWHDEFLEQYENILKIAERIHLFKTKLENHENIDIISSVVWIDVVDLLNRWVNNTYIGEKKPQNFQNAFQKFFCELYDLLIAMSKSHIRKLSKFARATLYQGHVYRYLGHLSNSEKFDKIEPNFNNLYVSWSKEEHISYIESKLYGTITHITCDISGDNYGIDLTQFGISKKHESEVVFPTIKECIKKIDYI